MIANWIYRLFFFTICFGLLLHFEMKLPAVLQWIGKLPGDMILKNSDRKFFFPVVSAAMISTVMTLIFHKKN